MSARAPDGVDPASFRDPSGFVFRREGVLYRQIDRRFAEDWDTFIRGGLYERLAADGLIVTHEAAEQSAAHGPSAHAVIRPSPVGFVSYPYEWSFGQLKAAALLTLEIQERALEAGMTLRDASAYNIQFEQARPILIDSLSFERAEPGRPWEAYRQFCEHFLAPLALMAYRDVRLGLLLRNFIDGIPLDLAQALLPGRTRLRLGLLSHIHLHAGAQRRHARDATASNARSPGRVSALGQRALLDSLRGTVRQLRWEPSGTEWAEYAEQTSYSDEATRSKQEIVERFLNEAGSGVVWDLGANVGVYSRLAAQIGSRVVAWDVDPAAVERHWRAVSRDRIANVLPLVLDLTNPSPGIGWALAERASLTDRADADVVMALALVHHLAIARNVPLPLVAAFLARLGTELILEFVPKDDPMVRRLLATRRDVFHDYSVEGLRSAFALHYEVIEEVPVADSARVIYRMRRRRDDVPSHPPE